MEMGNTIDKLSDLARERQHRRVLRLSFPNNDGPHCEFVADRLDAEEHMSRPFIFTIGILSNRANIALKDIHGRLISIELVQQAGTLRYFTGYCFSFRLVKAENIAHYEAILGPWLNYLDYRKDCYLFHAANLQDQTRSVLSDYGALAKWAWEAAGDAAEVQMTNAFQFNESDGNYLHRRWEAAGIYYHYEHDEHGHKLVLANESRNAKPISGVTGIVFQKHAGAREADAICDWAPRRATQPATVAVSGFDFKNVGYVGAEVPSRHRQGRVPSIEHYEYTGAYGFSDTSAAYQMGSLRMEEMAAAAKQFEAAGNNTRVMPGRWFRLVNNDGEYPFEAHIDTGNRPLPGTPTCAIDEFLITSVHHLATNNYLEKENAPHYQNTFTCLRMGIPWRPGRGLHSVDTRIHAPQTAIVVGAGSAGTIYTDDYGRVSVQFHWDRVGKCGFASSAWIRVATNWAGDQFGVAAVPRVGTEVIVQWLDGCPDRPIITGSVHNHMRQPPWDRSMQSALSGWRSRELGKGTDRSNHLIFDDTSGRIQAQLKSDHAHSQLSLGHITRIENFAGRKDARGEGWELATDAWGVARAARGLLVTTEARPGAGGAIKEMGETIQRLHLSAEQHHALAAAAEQAGAQEAGGQQGAAAKAAASQSDALAGHGTGDFRELAEPLLVLASPAGIATTTARSTHVASGEHTMLTAGGNLSLVARDSLVASVKQTLRLFVQKAGMKFIAAAGKITLQAQTDNIDVIASKVLALISESDWVDIRGKKGVRLHGVNNMLEIGEKVQFFTAAPVLFNGNLETLAPKNTPQPDPQPPAPPAIEQLHYVLQSHASGGQAHASVPYTLFQGGSKVEDGLTDAFGRIAIAHVTGTAAYKVLLANGEEFDLRVHQRLAPADDASHGEHTASNAARRALDDTADGRDHT
jgi:type VI secretion system secreted protein VgrG